MRNQPISSVDLILVAEVVDERAAMPYYFAPGSSLLPASASNCALFVLQARGQIDFSAGGFSTVGLLDGLLPAGLLVGEVLAGLAAVLLCENRQLRPFRFGGIHI